MIWVNRSSSTCWLRDVPLLLLRNPLAGHLNIVTSCDRALEDLARRFGPSTNAAVPRGYPLSLAEAILSIVAIGLEQDPGFLLCGCPRGNMLSTSMGTRNSFDRVTC